MRLAKCKRSGMVLKGNLDMNYETIGLQQFRMTISKSNKHNILI